MKTQNGAVKKLRVLDEIIDNAMGLPIESQNLLLMLAKGMAYTHGCLSRQCAGEQARTSMSTGRHLT